MTKHRSVVTGWDPDYVNPDTSTGRPKGVQTAIDMRIATTHDVLAEGVFAAHGTPAITGSPTDSASISPFMAAIESPLGGFYIVQLDDDENFTINMSNVGAVKIYVQQQDYEVNAAQVDSEVVIGVVYGATAIPDGALLLFTTTITSETSTSGLTFTPAFNWTGAASGMIRVPLQADLDDIAVIQNGTHGLVLGGAGAGEYIYNLPTTSWFAVSASNNLAAAYPVGSIYMNATNATNPATLLGFGTWAAFGAGRVPVGIDAGQTEFDTAGETGGAKTHTLTIAEMPSHNHRLKRGNSGTARVEEFGYSDGGAPQWNSTGVENTGGGGAHNNLQPYVVVYMWRRTA